MAGHKLNDVHADLIKRLDKGVLQHSQAKDPDSGLSHEVGALHVKEGRQHLYVGLVIQVSLIFSCVGR